jgi:hypothetical protein
MAPVTVDQLNKGYHRCLFLYFSSRATSRAAVGTSGRRNAVQRASELLQKVILFKSLTVDIHCQEMGKIMIKIKSLSLALDNHARSSLKKRKQRVDAALISHSCKGKMAALLANNEQYQCRVKSERTFRQFEVSVFVQSEGWYEMLADSSAK